MGYKREQLAASVHKSAAYFLQKEFSSEYITVTDVEVTPDGAAVTVWISIFNDTRRDAVFAHVRDREGALRTQLARDIQMRRVPEVAVKLDQRNQHAQAIEDTLREQRQHRDET